MKMKKIFIDAGHNDSGWNTGAAANGLREQDITFEVSKRLAETLEKNNIEVKLSRPTKETNLGTNNASSLQTRVNSANSWNADYFISIHCNAGGGTGVETLYKSYRDYAQTIQNNYVKAMPLRDRGIKVRNDLAVLNGTKMPAVLIELAFLDTIFDADILKNKQSEIAYAIAKGFFVLLDINETPNSTILELNLNNMVRLGVMQSPDYWRNQNIKWLNELLSNASKEGILDKRINNGICDIDIAVDVLIDAGIINSPDYWRKLIQENNSIYLKDLLINVANRCRCVLEKIVHAEAQGEDEKGQILVCNVVLNRSDNKSFPTGIHNVVFQANQFEPTRNGAYAKAVPSESVKNAVGQALDGVDYSQDALFFRSTKNLEGSWHQNNLYYLFTHQNHAFFR